MLHLKQPELAPEESDRQVRASVESMLDDIELRGEAAVRDLAKNSTTGMANLSSPIARNRR